MPGIQYSDLLSSVTLRLAGRANAYTTDQLLSAINEGKDELWKALVQTTDDYFLQQTTTTAAQTNTFAPLSTILREYTLPLDCLRPRFIEVTAPAGFERVRFEYRKINHPDFIEQRNQATAQGPGGGSVNTFFTATQIYFYTISGKNQFMLARYPEQAFTLRVWYVRALADGGQNSVLDETVLPFKSDIINFAVKRLSAVGKDAAAFALWSEAWRNGIIGTVQAAGPRSDTNPIYSAEAEY